MQKNGWINETKKKDNKLSNDLKIMSNFIDYNNMMMTEKWLITFIFMFLLQLANLAAGNYLFFNDTKQKKFSGFSKCWSELDMYSFFIYKYW